MVTQVTNYVGSVTTNACWISILCLILTFVAGTGINLMWRRKQEVFLLNHNEEERRFNKEQAEVCEKLQMSDERFKTITSSARDSIIMQLLIKENQQKVTGLLMLFGSMSIMEN